MEKLIKIILALLLMLCLFDLPYNYYVAIRFVSMLAFLYFCHIEKKKEEINMVILYLFLAILFQPFFKVSLGGFLWNIVDVVVALTLTYTLLIGIKPVKNINFIKTIKGVI